MTNSPNKLEAALAALPSTDLPALAVMARVCGHSLATKHAVLLQNDVKEITALRALRDMIKGKNNDQ